MISHEDTERQTLEGINTPDFPAFSGSIPSVVSHEGTKARRHEVGGEEKSSIFTICRNHACGFNHALFPASPLQTDGLCKSRPSQNNHALSLPFLRAFVPSCLRVRNKCLLPGNGQWSCQDNGVPPSFRWVSLGTRGRLEMTHAKPQRRKGGESFAASSFFAPLRLCVRKNQRSASAPKARFHTSLGQRPRWATVERISTESAHYSLRRQTRRQTGNGVARTIAFPNGVWERGGGSASTLHLFSRPINICP